MVRRPILPSDPDFFVHADLSDRDAIAAAVKGAQIVVHCAAVLDGDPSEYQRTNIDGTRHLVDAMIAAGCERVIHLSSVSAYDYGTDPRVYAEDHALWTEPVFWYGYSKAESERIIRGSGLPAVILRPVMVISMHPTSCWGPRALERTRNGKALLQFADVPHAHVDNLADAVVLAARSPAAINQAYNVIDGLADARDYFDAVYEAIGGSAPPKPTTLHPVYPGDKIRHELGYAPRDRWREFVAELGTSR